MAVSYDIAGKARIISLTPADANEATMFTAAGREVVCALWITNIDGTSAADATVKWGDGATDYALISTKSIAADDFYHNPEIYVPLRSGYTIKVTASAGNDLTFTIVILEGQSAIGHSMHQTNV